MPTVGVGERRGGDRSRRGRSRGLLHGRGGRHPRHIQGRIRQRTQHRHAGRRADRWLAAEDPRRTWQAPSFPEASEPALAPRAASLASGSSGSSSSWGLCQPASWLRPNWFPADWLDLPATALRSRRRWRAMSPQAAIEKSLSAHRCSSSSWARRCSKSSSACPSSQPAELSSCSWSTGSRRSSERRLRPRGRSSWFALPHNRPSSARSTMLSAHNRRPSALRGRYSRSSAREQRLRLAHNRPPSALRRRLPSRRASRPARPAACRSW